MGDHGGFVVVQGGPFRLHRHWIDPVTLQRNPPRSLRELTESQTGEMLAGTCTRLQDHKNRRQNKAPTINLLSPGESPRGPLEQGAPGGLRETRGQGPKPVENPQKGRHLGEGSERGPGGQKGEGTLWGPRGTATTISLKCLVKIAWTSKEQSDTAATWGKPFPPGLISPEGAPGDRRTEP
ncbi:hypothetical protein GWK47_046904 [Chionoecetes opilio]|uniref:Uncharacterized protein n=1 Tax=Chionoecetes opilio TaxID=41210 RepID=A0A8J4YE69_CHIOP|nr:hypothetical protein GWK47_046904 [Chionoecetes opilio]